MRSKSSRILAVASSRGCIDNNGVVKLQNTGGVGFDGSSGLLGLPLAEIHSV